MVTTNKSKLCILNILDKLGNIRISTQMILDNTNLFPDECAGCKSGTQVISAAMQLFREGKIDRIIAKGGFQWILKK